MEFHGPLNIERSYTSKTIVYYIALIRFYHKTPIINSLWSRSIYLYTHNDLPTGQSYWSTLHFWHSLFWISGEVWRCCVRKSSAHELTKSLELRSIYDNWNHQVIHWDWENMLAIGRRYIQMHFRSWKSFNVYSNFNGPWYVRLIINHHQSPFWYMLVAERTATHYMN